VLFSVSLLVFSLVFILVTCVAFTNAIEWFGKKLNLHQGIIGSIFAAVGTGMPETIVPIIAILFYHDAKSEQIGVGAIAGAPFMLGTMAFFMTGITAIICAILGKRKLAMNADVNVFQTDLLFFIIIYGVAIATTFVNGIFVLKLLVSIFLIGAYVYYVRRTFAHETAGMVEDVDELYCSRFLKLPNNLACIIVQVVVSLAGIIWGAHLFIKCTGTVSDLMGISPLILSIIITPIATELPEKCNSIIWVTKGKDTLALGNITGAMVFQCCFPVVFGILFTPWNIHGLTLLSACLVFASTIMNMLWAKRYKTINPFILVASGLLYLVFLILVLSGKSS
jgi:cation:H+ antiporter